MQIPYTYTKHELKLRYKDPVPIEVYHLIKSDSIGFRNALRARKSNPNSVKPRFSSTRIWWIAASVLVALVVLLFEDYFPDVLVELMGLIVGIGLIGGLIFLISLGMGNLRTGVEKSRTSKAISKYYDIHIDLVQASVDYGDYVAKVEAKKEYFDVLNRQVAFRENQRW